MSAIIREATTGDIDAMYEISCSVHLSPLYKELIPFSAYERFRRFYTPDPVRRQQHYNKISLRLTDKNWHVFVAEVETSICGFMMAVESDQTLELRAIFVDDIFQGKGIGRQFLNCALMLRGMPVMLKVIERNARAIRMYEKAGLKPTLSDAHSFYGAPIITMTKY